MSWLAISDGRHQLRAPNSAGSAGDELIAVGSLVIETLFQPDSQHRQTVLRMTRSEGWRRSLVVSLGADGVLDVFHQQDRAESLAQLSLSTHHRDATVRLTYSWDAPARTGWLAAENLETGRVDRISFDDPLPLPMADAAACVTAGEHLTVDAATALVAVSDRVEPVGLSPGLCARTPVATVRGPRRAAELEPGDLVLTAEGGAKPVRHVLTREVPAIGRFAPVALRAPYFGLEQTIRVAPDHRLRIEGADAEYLFGTDSVLVEARHLAHLAGQRRATAHETFHYTQIVLDSHDCLSLAGAWGESLYLGDLPDVPDLLSGSPLGALGAGALPRHHETAAAMLKPYEAMVLMSAMSA